MIKFARMPFVPEEFSFPAAVRKRLYHAVVGTKLGGDWTLWCSIDLGRPQRDRVLVWQQGAQLGRNDPWSSWQINLTRHKAAQSAAPMLMAPQVVPASPPMEISW